MSDKDLVVDSIARRALVLAAIERIERAKKIWQEVEQAPESSQVERDEAYRIFDETEAEFGWQWQNVKALLEAGDE